LIQPSTINQKKVTSMKYLSLILGALLLVIGCAVCLPGSVPSLTETVAFFAALSGCAWAIGFNVQDRSLRTTRALPAAAATVTSTVGIDIATIAPGRLLADYQFIINAPAVTVGMLSNAATIIYDVVTSASADMSTPTVVSAAVLTQTGAGGVGAAAAVQGFRLPTIVQRYVGIRATKSVSGDASTVLAVLTMRF